MKDLNLSELNVDFYTGNMHKWGYACKGTAFLWVNPLHQEYVHPLNTSHNYKMSFPDEFYSRGTNDSATKFVAAAEALKFYERWPNNLFFCCKQVLVFYTYLFIRYETIIFVSNFIS